MVLVELVELVVVEQEDLVRAQDGNTDGDTYNTGWWHGGAGTCITWFKWRGSGGPGVVIIRSSQYLSTDSACAPVSSPDGGTGTFIAKFKATANVTMLVQYLVLV